MSRALYPNLTKIDEAHVNFLRHPTQMTCLAWFLETREFRRDFARGSLYVPCAVNFHSQSQLQGVVLDLER